VPALPARSGITRGCPTALPLTPVRTIALPGWPSLSYAYAAAALCRLLMTPGMVSFPAAYVAPSPRWRLTLAPASASQRVLPTTFCSLTTRWREPAYAAAREGRNCLAGQAELRWGACGISLRCRAMGATASPLPPAVAYCRTRCSCRLFYTYSVSGGVLSRADQAGGILLWTALACLGGLSTLLGFCLEVYHTLQPPAAIYNLLDMPGGGGVAGG